MAFALGLGRPPRRRRSRSARASYRLLIDNDADLVEINPLAIVRERRARRHPSSVSRCLDAKITLDDSALGRHPDLEAMRDLDEEDPVDVEARAAGLSFIRLDGDIGCMVNGAGLAMATMDLVKRAGGRPANFLDIGGGARAEKVAEAMRLILARPLGAGHPRQHLRRHRAGRRGRARASSRRARSRTRHVPMVVRIVGTNAELAADILRERGDGIETATHASTTPSSGPSRSPAPGQRRVSILVGARHAPARPGHHRPRGRLPRQPDARLRHHHRRRRDARQGRPDRARRARAGLRHVRRARCAATGADTSVIFVPAAGAPDAILEALDAGIGTIFCITEHIPALDMLEVVAEVEAPRRAARRAPTAPARRRPARPRSGIIPGSIHRAGHVGLVSRSGTLTYEVVQAMTDAGIGQSTCVGIGGDPDQRAAASSTSWSSSATTRRPRRIVLIGRDRRRRRGGRRGLEARAPAGRADGRLHRRSDRAAGPAHGPRRRDHQRLGRHRRGARSRRSRRPASASPIRRPRSRGCSSRPASDRPDAVGVARRNDGVARHCAIHDPSVPVHRTCSSHVSSSSDSCPIREETPMTKTNARRCPTARGGADRPAPGRDGHRRRAAGRG